MPPAKRRVWDVQPAGDGQHWEVHREGGKRASAVLPTQQQALNRAREIAQHARLGQVRLKGEDGRIREEFTYGRDPRSIPG
jgi:hypothetical protein